MSRYRAFALTMLILAWTDADWAQGQTSQIPIVVQLDGSSTGVITSEPEVTLHFHLKSPDEQTITDADVLIDGRIVPYRMIVDSSDASATVAFSVPPRDSEATLIVFSAGVASAPITVPIKWTGETPAPPRPNLYALMMGIDEYDDPKLRLQFASNDARDVARALKKQEGQFYARVETAVITNGAASEQSVVDGLERLKQSVTPRDYAIVYWAGYAIPDAAGHPYFLTSQSTLDSLSLSQNSISGSVIREQLGSIAGRVVFFIDTCGSSAIAETDLTSFVGDLASPETGVVVYVSCLGEDFKSKGANGRNGAFAQALISVLDDSPAYDGHGELSLTALDRALTAKIGTLTGGRQHLALLKPDNVSNFAIASRASALETPALVISGLGVVGSGPVPIMVELLPPGGESDPSLRAVQILSEEGTRLRLRIKNAHRFRRFAIDDQPVVPDLSGTVEITLPKKTPSGSITLIGVSNDYQLSFLKIPINESDRDAPQAERNRYALIISIDTYDNFSKPPRNDGEAVAKMLAKKFGFKTSIELANGESKSLLLLDNPSRAEIFEALLAVSETLGEQDTLLIYFAGHGYQKGEMAPAFWVPRDGRPDRTYTYVSAEGLLEQIQQMQARSVLIVSDSCFSGGLFRAAGSAIPDNDDREAAIARLADLKSRIFISSGGTEPVLDKGCKRESNHSIFACAFLSGLQEIEPAKFRSLELFNFLDQHVVANAKQAPRWKEIYDAGHEGGDFVFERNGD